MVVTRCDACGNVVVSPVQWCIPSLAHPASARTGTRADVLIAAEGQAIACEGANPEIAVVAASIIMAVPTVFLYGGRWCCWVW